MTEHNNADEEITDAALDEAMTQPYMIAALVEEISERALISTKYILERDSATTSTKRDHFHKKLMRNNLEAADMLVALDKLVEAKNNNESQDDAEGNTTPVG